VGCGQREIDIFTQLTDLSACHQLVTDCQTARFSPHLKRDDLRINQIKSGLEKIKHSQDGSDKTQQTQANQGLKLGEAQ